VCVLHLTLLCCTDNPDFKDDPELYAVVKDNGLVGFEVWQVCVLGFNSPQTLHFQLCDQQCEEAIPSSLCAYPFFSLYAFILFPPRVCLFFSAQCVLTMADDYR
jgi:hypothetical protein